MPPCRLLPILFAAVVPSLTGCLGGYICPTLSVVPPVAAAPVNEDARAFRVDVTATNGSTELANSHHYELAELSSLECYMPQVKVGLDRGWFAYFVALTYGQFTHSTVKVRLYRPGYETLEIESWEMGKQLDWKKAEGVAAEETAVDDLLTTMATTPINLWMPREQSSDDDGPRKDSYLFSGLEHGSSSKAHRNALLFAAGEYDRVVALAGQSGQDQIAKRSADKTAKLRELAEQ